MNTNEVYIKELEEIKDMIITSCSTLSQAAKKYYDSDYWDISGTADTFYQALVRREYLVDEMATIISGKIEQLKKEVQDEKVNVD